MIKKISLKAVLISSLISLCHFKSASNISNDSQINIKTIEYKEKEAKDKYYDVKETLVDNNLLVTYKSKINEEKISNIDYVSLNENINDYLDKEIMYKSLYDVENMKFSLDTIVDDESFKIEGKLILNDDNNFSIIIKTDDKEYDFTTLYDKNSVDNVGFLTWLFYKINYSIARIAFNAISLILPQAIADMIFDLSRILIGERNIVSCINNISRAIVNYNHNRYLKEPISYIYDQSNYESYWMGNFANIANNGCGIVSMYNSLLSSSKRTNLKDLILRCDLLNSYTLDAYGYLGVDPNCINTVCGLSNLFVKHKYAAWNKSGFSNDVNKYCKNKYAILMVVNNLHDLKQDMHYFNVRYDEKKDRVMALNYEENHKQDLEYSNLVSFFDSTYPENIFMNGYIFYE